MKTTPDRWQRLKPLFGEALELPPDERARFAAESCRDDPELRRDLEALLESHAAAGEFLDGSAVSAEIASGPAAIGSYRIVRELGRGGMGAVYLAQDERLNRTVALKVLPASTVHFEHEAIAASALNHPNILTVHEVGEAAGLRYIVTEFIEGKTLRQRLQRGRPGRREAAGIALQIARALVTAHAHGIVHGDLKPENLMVRDDGLLKVLDFGIAQVAGRAAASTAGTPRYMAPEQAASGQIDARSDIYSFGLVLREIAGGRGPLARIGARASRRDPAARYQTAEAVLQDLERASRPRWPYVAVAAIGFVLLAWGWFGWRERSGAEPVRIERITGSGKIDNLLLSRDGRYLVYSDDDLRLRDLQSGAELRLGGKTRQFAFTNDSRRLAYGDSDLHVRELATGNERTLIARGIAPILHEEFSPNGEYLLYTAGYETADLWRFTLSGEQAASIARGIGKRFRLSPDGAWFAHVREDYPAAGQSALMIAAVAGGPSRTLHVSPDRIEDFLWSPTGDSVICGIDAPGELLAFRASGGEPRKLGTRKWNSAGGLSWQDNRTLIFSASDASSFWLVPMWRMNYPSGAVERITPDMGLYDKASAAKGRIAAVRTDSSVHVSVSGEKKSFQVDGAGLFFDLAWTSDGRLLYFSDVTGNLEIWSADPDGSRRIQLTRGAGANFQPTACAGGRYITFVSNRTGEPRLWRMDGDGANATALTGTVESGACSPDGRRIVYRDNGGVWLADIDGRNPRRIVAGVKGEPQFSPDSRLVAVIGDNRAAVYPAGGGPAILTIGVNTFLTPVKWSPDSKGFDELKGGSLWRQPMDGTPAFQPASNIAGIDTFAWSPDGKRLAWARLLESSDVVLVTGGR